MTARPPVTIAARRERVRRMVAKRPAIAVEVSHAPCPIARDRLIDLLVELLDERIRSGTR